jgi:anti-sigma factor RsiW
MDCPDIARVLDAFVDSELPPAQSLEIAQHAASCSACEVAIGELTALRHSVAALVEQEANRLDLSGVWPAVETAIGRRPASPARVVPLRRSTPALPTWGALAALAASVVFWLSTPATRVATRQQAQPAVQVASASKASSGATAVRATRPLNHADIDRLSGKDIAVRREPKSGTTIIWVSHTAQEGR